MTDQPKDPATQFGDALESVVLSITEKDSFKKTKQAFLDDLWDDIQYDIIDQMPQVLEGLVRDMTDRAVDAMLRGQPKEVERYLMLNRQHWRDNAAPMICGKLHLNSAMELRTKIALANENLLRDEIIADLKAQVVSLVVLVNKKDAEIDRLKRQIYG